MDMNEDKELEQLLAQNKQLQAKEMASEGMVFDQIKLAKTGTRALLKVNKDEYINGLKIGDFYLYGKKEILGDKVEVVPLQFVSLYTEHKVENGVAQQQTASIWTYEDGQQCAECVGSFYNRQTPDGNILTPEVWVVVKIIGRDDEPVTIRYKATGIKLAKKWKEDVRKRGGSSATMIYTIFEDAQSNKKGQNWTDINFAYTASLIESDKAQAIECLKTSNTLRLAYEQGAMIAKHNLAASKPKMIEATIEDDVSDEDVVF